MKKINSSSKIDDVVNSTEVFVDILPVQGNITSSSLLWEAREYFEGVKKTFGSINSIEINGKTYIAIHAAMSEEAPSNSLYKDLNGNTVIDNQSNRIKALKSCIEIITNKYKEKEIFSKAFLTGIYKETRQKHKKDIEYFIDNIFNMIPLESKWTVHHPKKRNNKSSSKPQITKKDEFYTGI